jgi:hypothetical protein
MDVEYWLGYNDHRTQQIPGARMSVDILASRLMRGQAEIATNSGLTTEEINLLAATAGENPESPDFIFARSAHLNAIKYLRQHHAELSPALKSELGNYLTQTFARTYGGAGVESGCISGGEG